MAKKIGLFFGSFNPIHVGHLIIANYVVEHTSCVEVWFVVSPQNPFKTKSSLLDERQRLYMVNLAVEDNFRLRSSAVEFDLPVPSYTVDTLAYLEEKYPNDEFCLIMGSDNLESIGKWKNYEVILERYPIYVYQRPGLSDQAMKDHHSIRLMDVPQLHVSASYIREQIAQRKSVQYLLTEPVRQYIEEMNFYREPWSKQD